MPQSARHVEDVWRIQVAGEGGSSYQHVTQPCDLTAYRTRTYPDRLLLQALVILIVRPQHSVHALLHVLAQLTAEMHTWRGLLTVDRRFPARRTWERRLQAIPATQPRRPAVSAGRWDG